MPKHELPFGPRTLDAMQACFNMMYDLVPREITLREVLDLIEDFLVGSLQIGANPLPHLRRLFPGVAWKVLDDFGNMQDLALGECIKADYFWLIPETDFCKTGYVTAHIPANTAQRSPMFGGRKVRLADDPELIDWLKIYNVKYI